MKKVLVVDDDPGVLNLFERFLSNIGYDPTVADSWETALSKFHQEDFDLVFLDIYLPGRNGYKIAKEMKDKNPDQKIIIITGLDHDETFKYSTTANVVVNNILYKPISVRSIYWAVTEVMGN